jgi:hypothetical protein
MTDCTNHKQNRVTLLSKNLFRAAIIFFIAIGYSAKAVVTNYTFTSTAGTYTPITGNILYAGGWDDGASTLLNIPFSFTYNGTAFTTLSVEANGFITLGAIPSGTIYCGLQTAPPNSIAGYGTDLVSASGTSTVEYTISGVTPNRQFVVQWKDVDHYANNNLNHWIFQVILNETTNAIQVVWGTSTDATTMGANSCFDAATESGNCGLLGNSPADFNMRKITNGVNTWTTSVLATNLSDVCNMSSSNFPAWGLTYTWTPPIPAPMVFDSTTTVFLNNLAGVAKGSVNKQILQIPVVTSGNLSAFDVTSIDLTTSGCTDASADIANAKVYFTGLNPTFSTSTQFGSTAVAPNGAYTVSGSATLSEGTNYFWIAYDISTTAVLGDTLSGCCTQITGTGTMGAQVPLVTCPAGVQTIISIGYWTPLATLAPDQNGGGMLLLSDGTVIVKSFAGGPDAIGSIYDRLTPDIHGSYVNGTWSQIAPMNNSRLYYSSQVLKDGRVYVAGGEYGTGGSSGETYNPLTNVWTNAPSTGQTISDANSEILEDGRVLQAMVNTSGPTLVKIYDPVTNTYANAPSTLGSHNESAWIKLPDNSILMVDIGSTISERYIPSLNQWLVDGTVPVDLYDPFGFETGGALLLPDGRAFFLGALGHTAYYTPSGTVSPGTWAAGPDIPGANGTPDAPMAMMVNGKILCAAAPAPTSFGTIFIPPTVFYEFDYISNTFTLIDAPDGTPSLNIACYQASMLNLPDGTILYASQQDSSIGLNYYVYTPSGTPLAAGKPTIANIVQNDCNSFSIYGTLFNGISEGACYGDDWQMETNYPIIRLSSGGNIYYARSFNWNSTGVMRGNLADSAEFTLPAGLPAGSYYLVVVANGIASDSVLFTPQVPMLSSTLTPPPVCSGTLFNYTPTSASPGATFTWTRAAVAGISNAAITIPQVMDPNEVLINTTSSPINVIYAYIISEGNCSSNQNVTVIVNPTISTVTGDTAICTGDSTTLTAVGGTGYLWSNSATIASITVNPTTTTTYYVTITDLNGCAGGLDSISITVNPLPIVNFSGLPATVCATDGDFPLTGNPSGGTYSGFGMTGNIFNPAGLSGNDTIFYTYTNSFGCSKTRKHIVNVLPMPIPFMNVTPDTAICIGSTALLDAGVYDSYLWSDASTTSSILVTTAGTYTVTVTNLNGCSATISQQIVVNPLPVPVITGSGPLTFCQGDSVVLNAGSFASYNWSTGATTGNIIAYNTGIYTVTVTDNNTCVGSDTVSVIVNPLPVVSFTGLPDTVCTYNGNFNLTGSPSGGTFSGAGVTGNVFNPATVSMGNHIISYSYTDGLGCENSSNHTVYVSLCTGIIETGINYHNLSVFPNPAKDKIKITFTFKESGKYLIKLDDMLGKTVLETEGKALVGENSRELNLNGIAKGVYTILLSNGLDMSKVKIVIE